MLSVSGLLTVMAESLVLKLKATSARTWTWMGHEYELSLAKVCRFLDYLIASNLNFCPPIAAATIAPPLGSVNTATP